MKLVFATNNSYKLEEIRAMIKKGTEINGLKEMGINEEIPETESTLEGNAIQKAMYVYKKLAVPCFADDTGLEVESLENRPGVLSARYAGEDCNAENNIAKLLAELGESVNRDAKFRTIIAFIHQEQVNCFEGVVTGTITLEKRGEKGFGYDPVFQPYGSDKTFAQMSLHEKNKISHRSMALKKFSNFLFTEIFNK